MLISSFLLARRRRQLALVRLMGVAAALISTVSWAQTASSAPANEHASSQARTDNPHDATGLSTLPSVVRVNAERIRLPGGENMGLLGTSYLLQVAPNIYVGPAAYGAFTGQRGGFFTVGAEASLRRAVSEFMDVEVGVYAGGGGGGGAAPVGGGLMLRTHADLTRDFGNYRAGVSLSQVRFPNGQIRSNQLGLVWSTNTDFRYVSRSQLTASGSGFSPNNANASIIGRTGMGFDRVQAVAGFYSPRPGVTRISGGPHTAKIGLVGARMERALTDNNYWGIEAAGAGSGGVAGYAEYLATLGTERAVWADHLVLGVRGAAGRGGGGDVSVGGGLLLKAAAYGIVRLTRDMGLTLEGGYTRAPQGKFRALHTTAALNLILDDPYDTSAPARTTRSEWVGGVSRYKAARKDGSVRDLDAVTMKVNRFVGNSSTSNNFYVSGQAHSAFAGGAGGYSVGLFGVGTQWPVFARTRVGAEFLAGAAGGGGVETRGGALMQPMAYVDFEVTKQLSLRLSGGKVKSLRGPFSSNVIDLSVAFPFGVTSHAYR